MKVGLLSRKDVASMPPLQIEVTKEEVNLAKVEISAGYHKMIEV